MAAKNVFSIVSGVLFVIAFFPYVRAIWKTRHLPSGHKDKVEPSKVSWIIWASLDSITFASMLIKHTLNGQIIGAIMGAWIVAALVMKYGKSGWSTLDKLCLAGGCLGIVLGFTFKSPELAMLTSIVTVIIGSLPTFHSAYHDPSKEDRTAWTIFWISCVVAIMAIPQWTFMDSAQVLAFTTIEMTMMVLLWIKPHLVKMQRQKKLAA